MFLLTRPSKTLIQKFIDGCGHDDLSYKEVGSSISSSASNFNVDHNRIHIGTGSADFEAAKTAVRNWKMFEMPWIELCWPDTPIETGKNVAVLVNHLGFYSL